MRNGGSSGHRLGADNTDLDHNEAGTGPIGSSKVHIGLVVGDVEALDTTGASLQGTGTRDTSGQEER